MTLVDIILPPVGLSDMRKSLNSFLHEPVDRHCTAFSTDCPDGFLFDKTSKSISVLLGGTSNGSSFQDCAQSQTAFARHCLTLADW